MVENSVVAMKRVYGNLTKNIVSGIEKCPKESKLLVGMSFFALGNVYQCISKHKEKKRHEEIELLHKETIRKQDAEIRDLSQKAEKTKHLRVLNDALVNALESEIHKGGEMSE